MLQVNDHIFGAPREIVCVSVALLFHVPLYFWHARPDLGPLGDPITEIEFSVEKEEEAKPPPPPPEEKKEEDSFMNRVKKAVGLSTPKPMPKLIVAEKPKTELMGMGTPNQIQPATRMSETMQKQAKLENKERSLANQFDVGKIAPKSGGLAGVGLGPGDKVGGGGTIQQKSTAFKIAQGDLPFAVKKGGGELASSDADAPRIALANRTDKRVKSVSTDFFGTGGGTGGGDGAGEGGGGNLKDKGKSGTGLAGVSGGFSPIGAPGTDSESGGGGLVGSPVGAGKGAGGGSASRVPYEITGTLSGRRIIFQVLPPMPDWAREKGIFAKVVFDFYVRPSGVVNVNKTFVRISSGFSKLDTLAKDSLDQWRFEPLDPSTGEQSGRITFTFKAL